MEKQEVLTVIEKHLAKCIEDLQPGEFDANKMLTDYGANSLDIVEIVSGAMRELKVRIPRTELGEIANIDGLADKLIQYGNQVKA